LLTIGTIGRLNWAKDHAFLLKSFARMSHEIPDARLVIVGGGELKEDLEKLTTTLGLSSSVLMTGDRSDVPALLQAFDIFALSSQTEGYSIALLEAAASGLPAVATDVGGNSEIVQHGITGLIARYGDASSFATALRRLAGSEAIRRQMGNAARKWALQHATVPSMMHAYAEIYEEALGIRTEAGCAVA
jgi:glycosyltransferase involved in cell wall biosynthesis